MRTETEVKNLPTAATNSGPDELSSGFYQNFKEELAQTLLKLPSKEKLN